MSTEHKDNTLLDQLQKLAQILCDTEPRLKLVKNEQDDCDKEEMEAATFLKLDGKRLGRDLELYDFMASFMGHAGALANALEEIILPLQETSPSAFEAGMEHLRKNSGLDPKDPAWDELLESLHPQEEKPRASGSEEVIIS
jgi:hypothetical protein